MNGTQQIIGGLLAYCFSLITSGPLKSYEALFITCGVISIAWRVFVFVWMPDSPMRAKCFSDDNMKLMIERVRSNQTGIQNKKFRPEQVKEALMDPQTWCYCLIAICTTLPTFGLGAFAGIIIKAPRDGLGCLLSSTYLTNRFHQNILIMLIYVVPSFIGTFVLMTVKKTTLSTKVGLLISYYIVLSFWAAQTLGTSLLSRNVGGQTEKTVCVTLNFVSWCTGNAVGPQVFLSNDSPRYLIAFSTHLSCYSLLVCVLVFLHWHLRRQNKKKDLAAEAAAGMEQLNAGVVKDHRYVHAFDDLTDRENENFRYIH